LEWFNGSGYQTRYKRLWATVDNDRWTLSVDGLRVGNHAIAVQQIGPDRQRLWQPFTVAPDPDPGPDPDPEVVKRATLIMSRSIIGLPVVNCPFWDDAEQADPQLLLGVHSLLETAELLAAKNVKVTSTVVPGWTQPVDVTCRNRASLVASWEQHTLLREQYGWHATSHGLDKIPLTGLTPAEQEEQICGSIEAMETQGMTGADAFFNFPENKRTTEIEAIAETCFTFGRKYVGPTRGPNLMADVLDRELIGTHSVAGGTCPGCERTHRQDYRQPAQMIEAMLGEPEDETWGVILFYKLVEGARLSGFEQWDCTSLDAADHWTNQGEVYCLDDFETIVDGLNDAGVEWVNPADVAELVAAGS
jgi:hypothetical protein